MCSGISLKLMKTCSKFLVFYFTLGPYQTFKLSLINLWILLNADIEVKTRRPNRSQIRVDWFDYG